MTSEEEEIQEQTAIEEENPQDSLAKKIKEQKKLKAKKQRRIIIVLAVLGFFSWAAWFLFKPFKASADFGICRTFLELQLPYPHTLYVSEIKMTRDGAMKLWYTYTDAFGEYRLESFECKLVTNPDTGALELESLKLNKVFLGPDKITALNNTLPYFAENPLILTWPSALPDDLSDLHFDFDAFRRIKINPNKN